jgi:hypothetical protein
MAIRIFVAGQSSPSGRRPSFVKVENTPRWPLITVQNALADFAA